MTFNIYVFITLSLFIFIPPIISNFVLGVLYQILFSILMFRSLNLTRPLYFVFSLLAFILLCSISISIYKGYLSEFWDLRDFFRLLISIIFFTSIYFGYKDLKLDKSLHLCFVLYLAINTITLMLWFTDRSLVSFLDHYNFVFLDTASYWRYSGFLGNPNYNGAMSVIILFFLLFNQSLNYNGVLKSGLILCCLLNISASYSRTAIVCSFVVIISYVIYLLTCKKGGKVYLFIIPIIGYLLYDFLVNNNFNFDRYDNISYTSDARFKFILAYFDYFNNNIENFIFGTVGFSDVGLSITDNGHLLIVYKYGLLVYVFVILSMLYFSKGCFFKLIFLLVVFLLMLTMPVMTNPRVFIFFTLVFFCISKDCNAR